MILCSTMLNCMENFIGEGRRVYSLNGNSGKFVFRSECNSKKPGQSYFHHQQVDLTCKVSVIKKYSNEIKCKSLELKDLSAQRLSFLVLFAIMGLAWHVRAVMVHNNT